MKDTANCPLKIYFPPGHTCRNCIFQSGLKLDVTMWPTSCHGIGIQNAIYKSLFDSLKEIHADWLSLFLSLSLSCGLEVSGIWKGFKNACKKNGLKYGDNRRMEPRSLDDFRGQSKPRLGLGSLAELRLCLFVFTLFSKWREKR